MAKKYNQRELFGILASIESITIDNWDLVRKIVDHMSTIEVISKKWLDWDYKNTQPEYYPLNLNELSTWTTYDNTGCINLKFYSKDNKLFCDVVIWNGDNYNGYPKNKKFKATLKFENKFIKELNDYLNHMFMRLLSEAYETHLKNQRSIWINNMKEEFLACFNN